MQAIILAGGFGTRLQAVVKDVPKPMAPINGKPFLDYLLQYLVAQGIKSVVLSLHHQYDVVQSYYKNGFPGLSLSCVVEDQPLGTGGAILHAFSQIDHSQPVFAINGDTFLALNYRKMYAHHLASGASFTMALREVSDCSRYGSVVVDDARVVAFREKAHMARGLINGGVYLLSSLWLQSLMLPRVFSLEQDFLLPRIADIQAAYVITNAYFIDIGVPSDYERANQELALFSERANDSVCS